MDWRVEEGSRISKLPAPIRPAAVVVRHFMVGFNRRFRPFREHHHRKDGVSTRHNDAFRYTPEFAKAERRANQASGWAYDIPYRLHQILWASHVAQGVRGDFVELGTGRGYMMSALLSAFPDWEASGRRMHLFDTFISIYPDQTGDQRKGVHSPHYATSYEDVQENFSEWSNVILHRGDVFETVPNAGVAQVAFLHIDLNYAPPEIFGLKYFWPIISPGGIVVLDDYSHAQHKKQYAAMNALAEELDATILSTPSGQGLIIKPGLLRA